MIRKGDTVRCKGIGYPHWKGQSFMVTLVFPDNTIGIRNCIRVASKDFYRPIRLWSEYITSNNIWYRLFNIIHSKQTLTYDKESDDGEFLEQVSKFTEREYSPGHSIIALRLFWGRLIITLY